MLQIPAERTLQFQESVIREMTRIAIQEDAVNLAQGLPDFSPPGVIIDAAKHAITCGYCQYSITFGDADLRQAIARDIKSYTGEDYEPETEITVTCGVSEAIIASMLAVVNPGEEVIFFEPYYENYLPAIIIAGGKPVPVELIPPRWEFRPDLFQSAITDKTKAVIINTPMNPTGRVFSFEDLSIIGELCNKYGIVIVTDEIYRHFVYSDQHYSPTAIEGMVDNSILNGGFSKVFSATGWRVGYSATKGEIAASVRKVHDYLTICAPHPFQKAFLAGLVSLKSDYYENLKTEYLRKRDLLSYGLLDLGFKLVVPQGAYYVLADYSAICELDDFEFAGILSVEGGVAGVPGSSFYVDQRKGRNYIRFSFAVSEQKIMTALDRIGERINILKS